MRSLSSRILVVLTRDNTLPKFMKPNYTLESKSQAHALVGFMLFGSFVGVQKPRAPKYPSGPRNCKAPFGQPILQTTSCRRHIAYDPMFSIS